MAPPGLAGNGLGGACRPVSEPPNPVVVAGKKRQPQFRVDIHLQVGIVGARARRQAFVWQMGDKPAGQALARGSGVVRVAILTRLLPSLLST